MATAGIITIGDELLIGQVIDTNSAWISKELNKVGIRVRYRIAIGDEIEDIIYALDEQLKSCDIILITGGLGPTSDDVTKHVLSNYFGGKLIVNEEVLNQLKERFARIGKELTDMNKSQAEVPDSCEVIFNTCGSAPGMLFRKEKKIIISMPGVPFEMKEMMNQSVLPLLKENFNLPQLNFRTVLTAGIAESDLATLLSQFEQQLPQGIKLAYLPNLGSVRLRLSADNDVVVETLDQLFTEMQQITAKHMVAAEDISLEEVISSLLKKTNQTLSTAESCTGGYIGHRITSVAGSSEYYKGGIISYSNEAKMKLLDVSEITLKTYGAVSEQTVFEMVKGSLKKFGSDYAIAVSGIMGPGGGSEEKPVGTVFIGVGTSENVIVKKYICRHNRGRNIESTTIYAFAELYRFINKV